MRKWVKLTREDQGLLVECVVRRRESYNISGNRRPVSSVGRVPDYRAGGRGFKPWPDYHSGSCTEVMHSTQSAAFVMTSANG